MKTLKLALVASLVAFLMVNAASADGFKSKPKFGLKVALSIEQAMQNPGLVAAIYNQISPEDLLNYGLPPYIVVVKYNAAQYLISGSREQWLHFFRIRGVSPPVKVKLQAITD